MKAILIITQILISLPTFAEVTDFERGYSAGRQSCEQSKEAWVCYVEKDHNTWCNSSDDSNIGFGDTRGSAILNISRKCRIMMLNKSISPKCSKF
jgi:hypothetical protein